MIPESAGTIRKAGHRAESREEVTNYGQKYTRLAKNYISRPPKP
jgi:hypothetical protein